MAMEYYASADDVATELGRPIPDFEEQNQVQKWIGRVERRIRNRIPDLDDRALDDHYRAGLVDVVAAVVARKVLNPEGMRTERIDDYYYDRGNQSADLWPTVDEWADLLPGTPGAGSGAFTVRGSFVPDMEAWSP